jgi:hypothetical protein
MLFDIILYLLDIILYFLDIIYNYVWPDDLFSKEISQMVKWAPAALGATCDPNGHADAGRCSRVRVATQTA